MEPNEKKEPQFKDYVDSLLTDQADDKTTEALLKIRELYEKLEEERADALAKAREWRSKYIHSVEDGDFGSTRDSSDQEKDDGPKTMDQIVEEYVQKIVTPPKN